MPRATKRVLIAAACMLTMSATTIASAQEDAPAGPSASDLFKRFDEINARIATLEAAMKDAAGKEDVGQMSGQMDAAKAELEALKAELAQMAARLEAVEATVAGSEDMEGAFDIVLSGYLRTIYTQINDAEDQTSFVGLNDGFAQGNARLVVDGTYETTSFRLSFDGAIDERDADNTARGEVKTELRDAHFTWGAADYLRIHVGQFKPPFDLEEQQSTRDLMFVSRSVVSRGVHGVEGINVDGLSIDRQVGLMINGDRHMAEGPGIGFGYALAVTNGTEANSPLNDNDNPAFFGRLELHFKDHITLGVAGYYNELTNGFAPDTIEEEKIGVTADLSLTFGGAFAALSFTQVNSSFPNVQAESDQSAQGYHGVLGYRSSYGFGYAVRYAVLDPTSDFSSTDPGVTRALEVDEVTHITPSLTWDVPKLPLRLQASYTITMENEARALDNDKLQILGQLTF